MPSGYVAYVLTEESQIKLLNKFPTKYPDVYGHHVTVKYPANMGDSLPKKNAVLKVVGYVDNGEDIEALVVSIDGIVQREDQSMYHITWSLNNKTKKPQDSNKLLHEMQYTVTLPIEFEGEVQFVPFGSQSI